MTSYPHRVRYTHKMTIYDHTNTVFSGIVSSSMLFVGYPVEDFKLSITVSGLCRIKIVGELNGVVVTERLSFGEASTQYTQNFFDEITTITSSYFLPDVSVDIGAVDGVGMPIKWDNERGPYNCEFGSLGGFQAQIDANSIGLGSKIIHYARVERTAPLTKDMEFGISPGYDGKIFVPIGDFENICTPPNYIPQEWAFRSIVKIPGE